MRRKKKAQKLNLIPILDAIFIFIFFLLMSAQFMDVYEFGSDKPITATYNDQKSKDEPLNLTVYIAEKNIVLKTGINQKVLNKYSFEQLAKYREDLLLLKEKHPKESSAILKPSKKVAYHKIVKVIDYTKDFKEMDIQRSLFDQIIFNTAE